jgi:hypothetical protein
LKKAPAYPALRELFRGAFHEDWPDVHGSAAGAVDDFLRGRNPEELQELAREATRALAELGDSRRASEKLLRKIGGAFEPESPAELRPLLERLAAG